MANDKSGATTLQWLPIIHLDHERGEVRAYCHSNVQAVAAVHVATERGLTARRFRAAPDAPGPIEIRVRDERLLASVVDVDDVATLYGGGK